MLPFDATHLLQRDGVQIIDAARRAGLDADVPSCEGWTLGDLLWHLCGVWDFWRFVVENQVTDAAALEAYQPAERVADGFLFDWSATSLNGLHSALTSTPPTAEVWTWTGANRDVWWVRRRMAHETAVHRWDAERVVGDPYEVWSVVAADGIDEYLTYFAPSGRQDELAGTVHIHCTDTSPSDNGEWMIRRLAPGAIEMERTHEKGDAAIRGRANDILLWLWGRSDDGIEILGDATLGAHLRQSAEQS